MVPLIDHKETGGVALDQSDEGGLAWKVVECICGCVVGALFGLVVGWIVPGLCIVMYFHYLRQQGDQAGLILLLTSPLGAVIGGVAGLRLRRWWRWGICALVGLGPVTVLLFIAPTVFLASPFVVPFGYLLLKRAGSAWNNASMLAPRGRPCILNRRVRLSLALGLETCSGSTKTGSNNKNSCTSFAVRKTTNVPESPTTAPSANDLSGKYPAGLCVSHWSVIVLLSGQPLESTLDRPHSTHGPDSPPDPNEHRSDGSTVISSSGS